MCSVSAMTFDGGVQGSHRVSSFTNNSLFLQVDDTLVVQDAPRHLEKPIATSSSEMEMEMKCDRDEERHVWILINLETLLLI